VLIDVSSVPLEKVLEINAQIRKHNSRQISIRSEQDFDNCWSIQHVDNGNTERAPKTLGYARILKKKNIIILQKFHLFIACVLTIMQENVFLFPQIIYLVMSLFSFSSFILFACLSRFASEGFHAIGCQLRNKKLLPSPTEAEKRIHEWKRNHETVCAYVHQLNRSFGPILFVRICSIFVAFVIQFFYVFVVIHSGLPLSYLFTSLVALVIHFVTLIVITSVSDNIRTQVGCKAENICKQQ